MDNNNVSDIINKFNNILKNKNIDLNKILGDNDEDENQNPLDFDFDLDTIIKLKNIFGQINDRNNPRNKLLYSLKPFLCKEKQDKLDQYIKLANLLQVIEVTSSKGNN